MTDLRMARTLGHRRRTRHAAASGGCRSASHPGQQSNFNLAKKSVASTRRRRPLLHAATRSHPPKIVAAHYGLKVLLELASLADERDDIARGPHVLWRRLHRDDHSPPVRLMADNSPYRIQGALVVDALLLGLFVPRARCLREVMRHPAKRH